MYQDYVDTIVVTSNILPDWKLNVGTDVYTFHIHRSFYLCLVVQYIHILSCHSLIHIPRIYTYIRYNYIRIHIRRPLYCLSHSLFRISSRKTSRLALQILSEGIPHATSGFAAKRASSTGSFSMLLRFHDKRTLEVWHSFTGSTNGVIKIHIVRAFLFTWIDVFNCIAINHKNSEFENSVDITNIVFMYSYAVDSRVWKYRYHIKQYLKYFCYGHGNPFCHISRSKHHKNLILVSKPTFSGSRNPILTTQMI